VKNISIYKNKEHFSGFLIIYLGWVKKGKIQKKKQKKEKGTIRRNESVFL